MQYEEGGNWQRNDGAPGCRRARTGTYWKLHCLESKALDKEMGDHISFGLNYRYSTWPEADLSILSVHFKVDIPGKLV